MTGRRRTVRHFAVGEPGWVVRSTSTHTRKDGTEATIVSWWYGPDRIIPSTYGSLDYSVAVFSTRTEAADAYRSIFGTLRRGTKVETVRAAVAWSIADLEQRLAENEAGALAHRDDADRIIAAQRWSLEYLRGERESRQPPIDRSGMARLSVEDVVG